MIIPYQYRTVAFTTIGGDLSPERLLSAYRSGIFPWPWASLGQANASQAPEQQEQQHGGQGRQHHREPDIVEAIAPQRHSGRHENRWEGREGDVPVGSLVAPRAPRELHHLTTGGAEPVEEAALATVGGGGAGAAAGCADEGAAGAVTVIGARNGSGSSSGSGTSATGTTGLVAATGCGGAATGGAEVSASFLPAIST